MDAIVSDLPTNVGDAYHDRVKNRERLSASVEADLLEAGRMAVSEGSAENLSAWVNAALRLKAEHDRRMRALDAFISAYEAEHGVITDEEMHEASRRAHARAVVVRGRPEPRRSSDRRRARTVT
jgi:hypothetical protein